MAGDPGRRTFYVSGFNAFGQLIPDTSEDVNVFQKIPDHGDTTSISNKRLVFAGWSETVFYSPTKETPNGHLVRYGSTVEALDSPTLDPVSGFGDHNGLLGVLGKDGRIHVTQQTQPDGDSSLSTLQPTHEHYPKVAHLAIAGNGYVTMMPVQSQDSSLSEISEFSSFNDFRKWYCEPSANNHTAFSTDHTLVGQVTQLLANTTAFVCLTRSGDVFTWGDPRHGSLGRSTGTRTVGIVESLGGIAIKKLSSGGWITAALSIDGAAYIFGASPPGTGNSFGFLQGLDVAEAALVEINDDEGEPLDVLDIAVGDGHVMVLVEGGRLFAAGENRNGQLGLGEGSGEFLEDWTEVRIPGDRRCVAVYAGPKSTFIQLKE